MHETSLPISKQLAILRTTNEDHYEHVAVQGIEQSLQGESFFTVALQMFSDSTGIDSKEGQLLMHFSSF